MRTISNTSVKLHYLVFPLVKHSRGRGPFDRASRCIAGVSSQQVQFLTAK